MTRPNAPSVRTRKAAASDLATIQACARAAYSKYLKRMQQTPAPMVADFASFIARSCVDVAVVDDDVAGYVVYFKDGNTMQLENVAIFPDHAGMGVGKRMLDHVESEAARLKLLSVSLYTNEVMTENQTYYTRQGYVEIKRAEQDGFKRVFYRKMLTS